MVDDDKNINIERSNPVTKVAHDVHKASVVAASILDRVTALPLTLRF